jgi:putative endonuclease
MNIENTSGRKAELVAASYLQKIGYKIESQNWRHPRAEIDIVAAKDNTAVCFEVKYRRSNWQGSGLDYITPKKLAQMKRAAQLWRSTTQWRGVIEIGAIEVSGSNFAVTACLTQL